MKLIRYLLVNGSLKVYNRRIKPRFFIFLIFCILALYLLIQLYISILPESLVTSNYWKGVF